MKKTILLVISLATLSVAILSLQAFAVTPPAATPPAADGQALEIAPPLINLSLNPGQTVTTEISLRDVSNGPSLVTNEVNDFGANGDDGTPKIITQADPGNPYSLINWIKPIPQILLKPHEIQKISVKITVPQNASPGGYFGVIRFTGASPDLKGTGVALSPSLGSLLLIKVNGDAKEAMSVDAFTVSHNGMSGAILESAPLQFAETLKNTGNMFEKPVGQVAITDMFGKKIAAVNVNLAGGNVLPQSTRKFSQPLDSTVIGNRVLFGHYTAHLSLAYGASGQTLKSNLGFWIIPYKLIGVVIVLLIIGFIGIRILIKRYNRYIISKSRK